MFKMDSDIVLCLVSLKLADCGVIDEDVVCTDRTDADLLLLIDTIESLSIIPEEVEDIATKLSVPCVY
jgi:hypothetical protein